MKSLKVILLNRLVFVFVLSLLSLLVVSSFLVSAHSPSNMDLSYNATSKELGVSLSHQVSDPNSHYVFNVVVYINNVVTINQNYSSQPGSSFDYQFNVVNVSDGDVIKVTALCNLGGSITEQITIGPDEVTESDDGATPGFELVLFFFSLIGFAFIINKKRY